jgi:hypothetical protein
MRAQEFVKPHQMAKLEKTGRIVEILRHQDQVDFSDEPGWYLINLEPGKRVAPDMKWIPDSTRFEWVREFKRADAVVEDSFDGIDVTMERDADEITVRAAAGGKQLGHVLFVQDGDALLPQDLEVDERYQGQAEDLKEGVERNYLWHGSTQKIPVLTPRQAHDTGGAPGSNQNAIYATANKNTAIKMGMAERGSDTAMFDQADQLVLFSGRPRRGKNVYLHQLPRYNANGQDMWLPGGNGNEFYTKPEVKELKPLRIIPTPVDSHLSLVRKPTAKDLKLQKKYSKQGVAEANLDENLRDWFGKEKWVRMDTKGNIKGDCARGSETEGKPKCLPQAKAHALGKKGRASAAQKKRREDPNPERRGKAINVATKVKEQGVYIGKSLTSVKILEYIQRVLENFIRTNGFKGGPGLVNELRPLLDQLDQVNEKDLAMNIQQMIQGAARNERGTKGMSWGMFAQELSNKIPELIRKRTNQGVTEDDLEEACWKGYHKEGNKELFGKTVPNCVKNEDMAESHKSCPECGGAMYPDTMINEKQDACYYKVKSRYKVWPSAYASGALVQCRKKGAANWGNKNESRENTMDELSRILELSTGLSTEARAELAQEFDLIESIIDNLAVHNAVDAEAIWEDLESLTDDELYVFATTTTIMETKAWQKANKKDRTAGMSQKAVNAYRRENPGSKLQTAVTTKPSKLKKGSKASKRRKSYCSRSRGQMKMHNISCAKTPDKAICKARRRWNC